VAKIAGFCSIKIIRFAKPFFMYRAFPFGAGFSLLLLATNPAGLLAVG
jgi:hypothetical protein